MDEWFYFDPMECFLAAPLQDVFDGVDSVEVIDSLLSLFSCDCFSGVTNVVVVAVVVVVEVVVEVIEVVVSGFSGDVSEEGSEVFSGEAFSCSRYLSREIIELTRMSSTMINELT